MEPDCKIPFIYMYIIFTGRKLSRFCSHSDTQVCVAMSSASIGVHLWAGACELVVERLQRTYCV